VSTLNAAFEISGIKEIDQPLTFTALNTDSGIKYYWDFGDGTMAENGAQTIQHTYTSPGNYAVTLTLVKGEDSNFSEQNIEINLPLIVDPNWSGPSVTVNSWGLHSSGTFPNINFHYEFDVTAIASSGGSTPYREFRWKVYNSDGTLYIPHGFAGQPDTEFVTTGGTTTLSGLGPGQGPFTIHCRVVGANGYTSLTTIKVVE
jgi:PKD repeat protein